jgi:hypothetical protein
MEYSSAWCFCQRLMSHSPSTALHRLLLSPKKRFRYHDGRSVSSGHKLSHSMQRSPPSPIDSLIVTSPPPSTVLPPQRFRHQKRRYRTAPAVERAARAILSPLPSIQTAAPPPLSIEATPPSSLLSTEPLLSAQLSPSIRDDVSSLDC